MRRSAAPRPADLQHGDRPGGRWLPAALGCNPATPLRARSRSVRGGQDPVQELNLHAAVSGRQRDRFVRLVPGLGPRFGAGKAFKRVIGAGFEPGDLAQLGRLGWRGTGQRTCPPAAASRSPGIQAARGDHPVQPGPDRGAFLEAAQPMPGRQQRVLQGILGVVDRPQHPVAMHPQLSLVRADKLAERSPSPARARSSSSPVTATSLHTRAPAAHPVTDHRQAPARAAATPRSAAEDRRSPLRRQRHETAERPDPRSCQQCRCS